VLEGDEIEPPAAQLRPEKAPRRAAIEEDLDVV
jgi:hypothetical protein